MFDEAELPALKKLLLLHEWGQRTLLTKLGIIHEDLESTSGSSPIESIRSRVKTPESIAAKLYRLGLEPTAANAKAHLRDIAGVRVICPFSRDIFYLVDLLKGMQDAAIVAEKDYVSNPKPGGYRSYHVIMEIPVFRSGLTEKVPVELQLRTEAMNFWATLEHKARYKYKEHVPAHLSAELVTCADKIAELDRRMFLIHDIIALINQEG